MNLTVIGLLLLLLSFIFPPVGIPAAIIFMWLNFKAKNGG